jgi:hypothetical protein
LAGSVPSSWWVNHKQTYRQETDGGSIWSPKANANGARGDHGSQAVGVRLSGGGLEPGGLAGAGELAAAAPGAGAEDVL